MPASASDRLRWNRVQAIWAISSRLSAGELPGLWSVATAIGTPAARRASIGGGRCPRRGGHDPPHNTPTARPPSRRDRGGGSRAPGGPPARRAAARRQGGPAHVRQLPGVQFDGKAQLLRGQEDLLGLCQREGNALAKHV